MALVSYLGHWPLGFYPCLFWIVMDTSSCSISVHHLCVIAWDRYRAISRPIEYRITQTGYHRHVYSVLAWIISIVIWLPVVGIFTPSLKRTYLNTNQCFLLPSKWMTTVQCVICYVLPMMLLLLLYTLSLRRLCERYNSARTKPPSSAKSDDDANVVILRIVNITTLNQTCVAEAATRSPTRNNKHVLAKNPTPSREASFEESDQSSIRRQHTLYGIRMLGAVIVVFFACWLPFCISWPLKAHCPTCIPKRDYEYTFWMAYLNSAINPMLYFIMNKDYRAALKRVWKKHFNCGYSRCMT